MVVLDAAGRPSFTALAERMHVRDTGRAARLAATLPVTYMIFDLLRYDGDRPDRPARTRSAGARLEELDLGRAALDGAAGVHRRAGHRGRRPGEPARGRGRQAAATRPTCRAPRSPDWIKVKFDRTGDYVIGGWRPGARKLGGLLVGVPTARTGWRFRGRVGGGIGAAAEQELLAALEPLARRDSPFAPGAVPREDARGAPLGTTRSWWSRSATATGPRTGGCASRASCGCARTRLPAECAEEDEDGR